MRHFLPAFFVLTLALSGCVSKAKARAQAQAAFAAGQQEALIRLQSRGPSVTIAGPVRVPLQPWTPDLTLARAIIEAGYFGATDPHRITIIRNGEEIPVSPQTLLQGQDIPLQAGDVIKIEEQQQPPHAQ